ncbi:hypothetical protein T484DRAFT_1883510 [Baffinella frigidus]|nr:hypothetical protein T484DRAFT_1883510 [Cryptophyta sp. CCMP2293]
MWQHAIPLLLLLLISASSSSSPTAHRRVQLTQQLQQLQAGKGPPLAFGAGGKQSPASGREGQAQVVGDPKAPDAKNCIAVGTGLHEGKVGEAVRFDVIIRDMFGDGHQCSPLQVAVRVVAVRVVRLSPARDEGAVQCTRESSDSDDSGESGDSRGCETCAGTTSCFLGLTEDAGTNQAVSKGTDPAVSRGGAVAGACAFSYTPEAAGMYQVSVAVPSAMKGSMVHIQGSPFRAYVEDGSLFLPNMTFSGYVWLFVASLLGAAALSLFFVYVSRQAGRAPTEYDRELGRLHEMARDLESTRQVRQEREELILRVRENLRGEQAEPLDESLSDDVLAAGESGSGLEGTWLDAAHRGVAWDVSVLGGLTHVSPEALHDD